MVFYGLLLLFSIKQTAKAQSLQLTIKEMLQKAQANIPQLEALRQQALMAGQNIALAKNSLVPDLTVGYQANYATVNNITGMSYPGFLLPISGPPSVSNELNLVPGSAMGALIKWTPYTFGQRNTAIEKATAQFKQANAAYNEQLFQYQYSTITIYLEIIYLKQVINSIQAAINRNNIGLNQSLVLAKTGLKAGIDTTQFQAAMAQAGIDRLQAERVIQQKLAELSRLTGVRNMEGVVLLTDSVFKQPAITMADTVYSVKDHPYYQHVAAQKETDAAGLKEIQKSWLPLLDIWGNAYARGSGVNANGTINKSNGFNLSRTNIGAGVQLSFPVLGFTKQAIKKKQYQFLLKADEAKLSQVELDIACQVSTAVGQLRQDANIAVKTSLLLQSAQDVYAGLKISYETGLIDYTRLSQAQYDLQRAEVSNANAGLQLWRSLLAVAIAKGNLNLFLEQLN